MTINKLIINQLIPLLKTSDSPAILANDWLESRNFGIKALIQVAVCLALAYHSEFKKREQYEKWYREEREKP